VGVGVCGGGGAVLSANPAHLMYLFCMLHLTKLILSVGVT